MHNSIYNDSNFVTWVKINYAQISNHYVNAYYNLLHTGNWIKSKRYLMCIYLYRIHLMRTGKIVCLNNTAPV